MKRSRPLVLTLAAAFIAVPCALGISTSAQAATAMLTTAGCTHHEPDLCHFPEFKADAVPNVEPGETFTITGKGANYALLGNEPARVYGGFRSYEENGGLFTEFLGEIKPDGTWSLTLTAPGQEAINRVGDIDLWVNIKAYEYRHDYWIHDLAGEVNFAKTDPRAEEPKAPKPGWYQEGNTWYWGDDKGVRAKGWKQLGGSWYYFDTDTAAMKTGWVKDGAHWYYLKADGAMATGWVKDGAHWYYLKADGAMATGWVKDGAHWYYLQANGAMATGWVKDGAHWYYLQANGAMATGWVKDGAHWYYLQANGAMVTGRQHVDGRWSSFAANGAWLGYN